MVDFLVGAAVATICLVGGIVLGSTTMTPDIGAKISKRISPSLPDQPSDVGIIKHFTDEELTKQTEQANKNAGLTTMAEGLAPFLGERKK